MSDCSECHKALSKKDIFCANCGVIFCSTVCKKKGKKRHGGGRCETVHNYPSIFSFHK